MQHAPEGSYQDPEVKGQTPVVHIPDVFFESFVPTERVSPVDLSPTANSRLNLVAPRLFCVVTIQVLHKERPRPDKAHLTREHVPELRDFIQAVSPQQRS